MNLKKNKNHGLTLIELLVTLSIFILAILGVTMLAKAGINYYNFILNQGEILSEIQKSVILMTRQIREMKQADSGAFAIGEASNNQFIFYSDIDSTTDVERIRYFLSGTCLKKGIIKPSGAPSRYLDINEQISDISCNITNGADEPIFSYYSGYPNPGSLLSAPVNPNLVKVAKIYLRVSSTGKRPLPVSKTFSEYVSPRNINQEESN